MTALIWLNSIAGGESVLVACAGEDGLHVEFSKNHGCPEGCRIAYGQTSMEADRHDHCTDLVLSSELLKNYSDTRQLVQTPVIPCTDAPFHVAENSPRRILANSRNFYARAPLEPPGLASAFQNIPMLN